MAAVEKPKPTTTTMRFAQDEGMSRINRYSRLAAAVFIPSIAVLYAKFPFDLPDMPEVTDRVVFALKCHVLTLCTMMEMLKLVLIKRRTVACNPLDPEMAAHTEIPARILTNSVEQFSIFFPSTLILSTNLGQEEMKAVPILILTWTVARLLFAYGQEMIQSGALNRN